MILKYHVFYSNKIILYRSKNYYIFEKIIEQTLFMKYFLNLFNNYICLSICLYIYIIIFYWCNSISKSKIKT